MPERKKPKIIVTRKLPDLIETRMMELFDPQLNLDDRPLDRETLIKAVKNTDVLVPTVTDKIDSAIINAAGPRLKLIASFGTGVDHIDIQAAIDRQIMVTNTLEVLTEDTADMTMALMLAVSRRLIEGSQLVNSGKWTGWAPTSMLGARLNGKRLGIIGMGRIGSAVARRARGFNMSIHYHNRRPAAPEIEEALEATYWSSLDQMLARVDIVSINCPHTPATYHLLSHRRLALLPLHAIIVNTSRGEVIDENALADSLERSELAGAGLDVYEHEPAVCERLVGRPDVVLLPHMGSATVEGRIAMGERVIVNIRTFADGHSPPDRVLATEF